MRQVSYLRDGQRDRIGAAGGTARAIGPQPHPQMVLAHRLRVEPWPELVQSTDQARRPQERNTPASAGRTCPRRIGSARTSEHPRVSGEDVIAAVFTVRVDGTPPRRRGGRRAVGPRALRGRNTPASAGRTRGWWEGAPCPAEHPRVGGEDRWSRSRGFLPFGTPPRRRGGRTGLVLAVLERRNTPASAGRTGSRGGWRPGRAEHPRVGGEDAGGLAPGRGVSGTPPRRRGGRASKNHTAGHHRNTPASAGRTCSPAASRPCSAEHPRVGGEDICAIRSASSSSGTPPRRRGGRPRGSVDVGHGRNTPASAGRTAKWTAKNPPWKEHPRVGGEDEGTYRRALIAEGTPPRRRGGRIRWRLHGWDDRNTPASAGRTLTRSHLRGPSPEHPRVGGEDELTRAVASVSAGTPPRRRGGRPLSTAGQGAQRNTPASAGRTLPDLRLKEGFATCLPPA